MRLLWIPCYLLLLISCDATHTITGTVIDSVTKRPIADVRYGKYSGKTTKEGLFNYRYIGGMGRTQVSLYKEGYHPLTSRHKRGTDYVIMELKPEKVNPDSILKLSKEALYKLVVYGNATFNPDSSIRITSAEFENEKELATLFLTDSSIKRGLHQAAVEYHVRIMRCLNTINAQKEKTAQESLLLQTARDIHYADYDFDGWFTIFLDGEYYPKIKIHYSRNGEPVPLYARYTIIDKLP